MSPIPVPNPTASAPPTPTPPADTLGVDAARRAYDRAEREAMYAGYRLFGYLTGAHPWLVEQAAGAEARGDRLAVSQFGGLLRLLDEWRAGYRLFGYLNGARPWLVEQAAGAEARGDRLAVSHFGGLLRLLDEWRELERAREVALHALEAAQSGGAR